MNEPRSEAIERTFQAEHLLEVLEGDVATAQAVAGGFVAMRSRLVDRLAAAAGASDWPAVCSIAHEIKGMAGSMGARRLHAAGERIEHEARTSRAAVLPQEIDVLRAEWGAVEAVLRAFRGPVAAFSATGY